MKKFLPAILISIICLSGCSTEREDEPLPKPMEERTLLTKITTKDYRYFSNSPLITVTKFSYNDHRQLTEINSEAERTVFEYENSGKPVKSLYYKPDGTYIYTKIYVYEGDRLTKINSVYEDASQNSTVTYTYNASGQMVGIKQCKNQNCSSPTTFTYTYINKNVATAVSQTTSPSPSTTTRKYTFDDKKNPYSSLNTYIRIMLGSSLSLNENNYDSQEVLVNYGTYGVFNYYIYNSQYNSENYPTFTSVVGGNATREVEYLYEYSIK